MLSLGKVQEKLHIWGAANQVTFDGSKASTDVPEWRLLGKLGTSFDCKLDMDVAVRALVAKDPWKVQILLRSQRSFSVEDLAIQYKQQVLIFVE